MDIIERKAEMREFSIRHRGAGRRVGLVPTMGALHEGHGSLTRAARRDCDVVVVSLFVNPTQFAPGEDFERYPRAFVGLGVDALFAPAPGEMYPPGGETSVVQDRLATVLEGASRPTHFRGVLTVVLKLFNVVLPHVAYFGQKDYQQTVVIRRMVADLDVPVEVRVLPTIREADGLARSTRNGYLSGAERKQAVCLYEALTRCGERFAAGETDGGRLKRVMRERIEQEPDARIDYVELVRPDSLAPAETARRGDVALVAVQIGATRLIDNMALGQATGVGRSGYPPGAAG